MNFVSAHRKRFAIGFRRGTDGRKHEYYWRFRTSSRCEAPAQAVQQVADRIDARDRIVEELAGDPNYPPKWKLLIRANKGNLKELYEVFDNFREVRKYKLEWLKAHKPSIYATEVDIFGDSVEEEQN